jgi:hypothetical protein
VALVVQSELEVAHHDIRASWLREPYAWAAEAEPRRYIVTKPRLKAFA